MIPCPRDPKTLSSRAVKVLRWLVAHPYETLICERLECWYGLNRTNYTAVKQLLECAFISQDRISCGSDRTRHYVVNESGERFLRGELPYRDSEGRYHATMFTLLRRER